MVFPTHVGVFLKNKGVLFVSAGLPHARGGVSNVPRLHHVDVWSSPRTWGCFSKELAELLVLTVFPTHVGVFLD